jgi:hypothetical protein
MKQIEQFNNWFNNKFGWFFTNGMKIQRNIFNAELVVPRKEPEAKYILKRLNDGLTKTGSKVLYIEYDGESGENNKSYDNIKVGCSLMLEPRMQFTWLTTTITEIVEQKEDYIKFKTSNSIYELFKLK